VNQDGSVEEIVRDFADADEAFRLCAGWLQLEKAE
jgi:hypothetical protein